MNSQTENMSLQWTSWYSHSQLQTPERWDKLNGTFPRRKDYLHFVVTGCKKGHSELPIGVREGAFSDHLRRHWSKIQDL